ncbi:MAG: peptidoglycan-binding domain-containing protein [Candidatus Caenarcaniphilales bacterium]|nr:peptidoglycan-binding domain-containing protein [Candidatus Caenarcaniphilales bacterium]
MSLLNNAFNLILQGKQINLYGLQQFIQRFETTSEPQEKAKNKAISRIDEFNYMRHNDSVINTMNELLHFLNFANLTDSDASVIGGNLTEKYLFNIFTTQNWDKTGAVTDGVIEDIDGKEGNRPNEPFENRFVKLILNGHKLDLKRLQEYIKDKKYPYGDDKKMIPMMEVSQKLEEFIRKENLSVIDNEIKALKFLLWLREIDENIINFQPRAFRTASGFGKINKFLNIFGGDRVTPVLRYTNSNKLVQPNNQIEAWLVTNIPPFMTQHQEKSSSKSQTQILPKDNQLNQQEKIQEVMNNKKETNRIISEADSTDKPSKLFYKEDIDGRMYPKDIETSAKILKSLGFKNVKDGSFPPEARAKLLEWIGKNRDKSISDLLDQKVSNTSDVKYSDLTGLIIDKKVIAHDFVLNIKTFLANQIDDFTNDGTSKWTPDLTKALKDYQTSKNLNSDGIWGPNTEIKALTEVNNSLALE